jgi:hypothetical protein
VCVHPQQALCAVVCLHAADGDAAADGGEQQLQAEDGMGPEEHHHQEHELCDGRLYDQQQQDGQQQHEQQQQAGSPADAAGAAARRSSLAASEGDDNLLSALADDNEDAGGSNGHHAAAAAAGARGAPQANGGTPAPGDGDDAGREGSVEQLDGDSTPADPKQLRALEQELLAAQAAGAALNARQRRTLARLAARESGGSKGAGAEANGQTQQQPAGPKVSARAPAAPLPRRLCVRRCCHRPLHDLPPPPPPRAPHRRPQAPPSPKVNDTILYVSNMHWWTTDAALEGLVRTYGPVTNCRFLEERATGKSKGAAVVEFADAEAAKRCKAELHG